MKRSKFGLVKNGYFISDVNVAQVIENKAQSNFTFSENINGLKNQSVKNGAQVIENIIQRNFPFNENINQPKFGLVKTDIRSETCVEFSYW